MAKWKVLKDANGPISAGFVEFTPGVGESVDEYDDPQKSIHDALMVRTKSEDTKLDAVLKIDASKETGTNKAILEFLQDKYS